MRTLFVIVAIWCLCSGVLASDCGNDATPDQIGNAVEAALRQKQPGDKPVVANAEVAQAIHRAVAGAMYGTKDIEAQRPFRAIRSGEFWVVYGCLPKDMLGGVAVTVIRASNGEVLSITHGQ